MGVRPLVIIHTHVKHQTWPNVWAWPSIPLGRLYLTGAEKQRASQQDQQHVAAGLQKRKTATIEQADS